MALLQPDKAVYHHPLDTVMETIKSEAWAQSEGDFAAGKVSDALFGVVGSSNTFGTGTAFHASGTINIFAATISATSFVVVYNETTNAGRGTAKIGTVSGTDIAFGAGAEFLSGGAEWLSVAVFDSTKFVVAYQDGGDFFRGTAKIGTVSGTDIAFGTETEFLSTTTMQISVTVLSATEFVVAYRGAAMSAKIGTVSGSAIVFGTEAEFLASDVVDIFVTALSATKFVVAFKDASDGHGGAKVGTVSGTAITFGAEAGFNAGTVFNIWADALSATKVVVAYRDSSDAGHGTAKIGTISGTVITFGAEAEFLSTGTASAISAKALSASTFVVVYRDGADSGNGTAKIGTVSGTAITFGGETEFLSFGGTFYNSAAALSSSSFAVAYQDGTWGTAKVGTLAADASLTGMGASYDSVIGSAKLAYTGWMKEPSS